MLTEEQRKERKTGIGGSDAAAICGLSKWKTPLDIYIDKLTPDSSEEDYKEYIHFGNVLEPIVIEEYCRRTGNKVEPLNKIVRHPKHTWMLANVDGVITNENGVLECKTANAYSLSDWGESWTDHFPDQYLLQCAHYAIVLDVEFVDLAVLIGGSTFRMYKYKRNKTLEEKLIEREKRFWNEHILAKNPPDAQNAEDALKLWESDNGELVTINLELKERIEQLCSVKKTIQELNEKKEKIEMSLKNKIMFSAGVKDEFGNILLTWKRQEANRFDIERFKQQYPDIYKGFIKKTANRVLRIRSLKDE